MAHFERARANCFCGVKRVPGKCVGTGTPSLIHLGYLTWNGEERTARIPNEEVRAEFRKIIKGRNVNRKWMELIGRSQKLLEDTIAGNGTAVANAIEEIRDTQYAPTYYNDEQALRYVRNCLQITDAS